MLFLTPGPIVTLIVATGARRGTRAALLTVAGASAGNAVLVGCIAVGLGWILKTSAEIFDYLRWVGAAYLVFLGIQAWRHAGATSEAAAPGAHVHAWRGFIVAITNPKTIAFFTAFLPQFLDPTLPVERQLLVMCAVSVTLGSLSRFRLGHCRRPRPRLVPQAQAQPAARPGIRRGADRRRHLAQPGAAAGLILAARRPRQRSAKASLAPSATNAPAKLRRIQVMTRGREITWSLIDAANSP